MGSKFFPLRVDLFSKGSKTNFDRDVYLENVSVLLKLYECAGQDGMALKYTCMVHSIALNKGCVCVWGGGGGGG